MDVTSDDQNCGGCGTPCGTGEGCAAGSCLNLVAVGAPAFSCENGGPPIQLTWDGGSGECAGALAQTTFRWALCTCEDIANLSSPLTTDGYDSSQGPYAPDGGGGGVGSNGAFRGSSTLDIGGAFWVGSSSGVSGSSVFTRVLQDVWDQGPFGAHSLLAESNATINGDITLNNASDVVGTLQVPSSATINGPLSEGVLVRSPVSVSPPCDCSASQLIPVGAIVAAHSADGGNDDSAIGLDPAVFASGTQSGSRLDLPCGSYYLTGIDVSGKLAIVAHGNTALYVGGDVTVSTPLTLTLDPSSTFDVFIAGNLCISSTFNVGNPNYPAQMRVYVGGDSACGKVGDSVDLSGSNTFASNIFTVNGFEQSAGLVEYGGIFAGGNVTMSHDATIHFDRGVLGAGSICPMPDAGEPCASCRDCENQACVGGQCGPCGSDSDCCAPLVCQSGTCVVQACDPSGASCHVNTDCCHGLSCYQTGSGAFCDGASGCTCRPYTTAPTHP